MPSIDDLTSPDLVVLDLTASNPHAAVEEMAGLLERNGRLTDRESYVRAVMAREEETGGTGMESGIAIPHAKSAAVTRPAIAFARSGQGLDFGAEDGTRADLVFLIAAPEGADELHVKMLSRLARRLVHEEFRTRLREAATPEEVVAVIREEVKL
ncbi:MAG TPA: fructose PTS transporter subunit IIA [Actinomycetota bacterium]|jgi:fructose-specific phosphotransferase system IIA component|nr:fructose PTS transporter subunit IIA [Actinomycetota bacterium]